MRQAIHSKALMVTLLILTGQSALADSASLRAERPISVMAELSAGGPNGTAALNVNYDFTRWGGVGLGVGYSKYTQSLNTSAMFNWRAVTGGGKNSESSWLFSLGLSYRGESKEEALQLWGTHKNADVADYTLFASASMGYALAHHSGFRYSLYVGWELPITAGNYKREEFDEDGDLFSSESSSPDGRPSTGMAFGYAF